MTSDENPPQRPTNVRWGVFGLMVTMSWLLYLHRYVISFLKPILAKEWGLNNEALGEIDGAFALAYGVFQFPLAILADVFGVHLMLSGLMLVWLLGMGLMCRATTVQGMWYAQAALGMGQSAVYACLNRVGRMWYPTTIRTTMQGVVGILAGRLGNYCTAIVFGTLMLGLLGLTWQTAVGWLIAVGLVQFTLFALVFRNSPRQHPWVNESEARLIEGGTSVAQVRPAMSVFQMLSTASPRSVRNLMFVTLQSLLSTIADTLFSNWIPKFLSDVNPGLEYTKLGIYASLPLLGGACAGLVGGVLNDYLIAKTGNRRWSRVAVAMVGKGLAAALLMAALLVYRQPYLFCIVLFFVKFFGDWSLAALWGVVSDIGGRATASIFAINNAIATIGLYIAPRVFGWMADNYGWPAVFATVSATLALCALSWLAIDCTIPVLDERDTIPA